MCITWRCINRGVNLISSRGVDFASLAVRVKSNNSRESQSEGYRCSDSRICNSQRRGRMNQESHMINCVLRNRFPPVDTGQISSKEGLSFQTTLGTLAVSTVGRNHPRGVDACGEISGSWSDAMVAGFTLTPSFLGGHESLNSSPNNRYVVLAVYSKFVIWVLFAVLHQSPKSDDKP